MDWKCWQPSQEVFSNIENVLQDALVPDSEVQRSVQSKLAFLQSYPDLAYYLLNILGKETFSEEARSLSGVLLKNNINTTYDKLTDEMKANIKNECLRLLRDPSKEVRNSVSNIIIVFVWKAEVTSWPELVPYLTSFLEDSLQYVNEIALTTLFKICEEYITRSNSLSGEVINILAHPISKFINLLVYDSCTFRKDILRLLNQAMENNYYATRMIIDVKCYIDCLLEMCESEDLEVQRYVCQAFGIFMEYRENAISIHLPQIIHYIMEKTQNEDGEVALQACEFWLTTSRLPNCCDILQPHLERLVPILLNNMKYSDFELNALKDSLGNDSHIQDKVTDVRPFTNQKSSEDDDEYGDDDYDGSEIVDDPCIGWTLRKCSAASLDSLAVQFQGVMVPIVFSHLNAALDHSHVLVKESAILALGAIADGCISHMHPILPHIIPHLVSLMKDEVSIIRVITCWTVSRYVNWIIHANEGKPYFEPVMTELIMHFLDSNKRVQRAAISAFCIFQEEACLKLIPYITFILQAFSECFTKLQLRSHMLLYDAIGSLAQSVGNTLNQQQYIDLLMPPLIKRLNELQNIEDDQFLAVVDCISNVAQALEVGFLPYAEPIYLRCLYIIQETVAANVKYNQDPEENDAPDKEPMIVCHDMLLSMAISLKSLFVKFVTNSNLVQLLHATMQDEVVRVRIPAIALFGELVKLCYPYLSSNINEFVPLVIKNLNKHSDGDGACNNAAWVIGKLCIAMGVAFQPYVQEVLECYSMIMENPIATKAMYQTVAISVCTLGLVFPEILSPILNLVLSPCCMAMRNVRDCEEKDIGFRGLCQMIIHNPSALNNDFIYFCDAVASWNEIKPDLRETIRNILLSFRQQMGEENWSNYYAQFPPHLKTRLNKLYEI